MIETVNKYEKLLLSKTAQLSRSPYYERYRQNWSRVLLLAHLLLNVIFIFHGPLHLIDYPTYIEQVSHITQHGILDYAQIQGTTGPLVYRTFSLVIKVSPAHAFIVTAAGHVLIFSIIERLFGQILPLQDHAFHLFVARLIYIALQLFVTHTAHQIYALSSETPHIDCLFFLFTVRARNIFVNSFFNDCWETAAAMFGILMLLKRAKPWMVILALSVASSIKMNALLWAPGVFLHYFSELGGLRQVVHEARCGLAWQVGVALPFLLTHPIHYVSRAFQFERQFAWFNSVAWKFVPKSLFESSLFAITLALLHMGGLFYFCKQQLKIYTNANLPITNRKTQSLQHLGKGFAAPAKEIASCLFTTHFVGIVFSRSLHYSFYVWYFYTLPLLYATTKLPWVVRIPLALFLELSWNAWQSYNPSDDSASCATWQGALGMFACHMFLLVCLVPASRNGFRSYRWV